MDETPKSSSIGNSLELSKPPHIVKEKALTLTASTETVGISSSTLTSSLSSSEDIVSEHEGCKPLPSVPLNDCKDPIIDCEILPPESKKKLSHRERVDVGYPSPQKAMQDLSTDRYIHPLLTVGMKTLKVWV